MAPKVSKFTQTTLKPVAGKYNHLLPTVFTPVEVSFHLSGAPSSVSNAIRRCLLEELPVWAFRPQHADMDTDDRCIIWDMVMRRFALIPIAQTEGIGGADNAIDFRATNPADTVVDIKSSGLGKVCNETFTLFTLQPGRFLTIHLPRVRDYGYNFAGHTLVSCAASVCEVGGSTSTSQPTEWDISFTTHGNMPPRNILHLACDEIIARLKKVPAATREQMPGFTLVSIPGESHTIGQLLTQNLCALGCTAVHTVSPVLREITLKIISDDAARDIDRVVSDLVDTFETIRGQF